MAKLVKRSAKDAILKRLSEAGAVYHVLKRSRRFVFSWLGLMMDKENTDAGMDYNFIRVRPQTHAANRQNRVGVGCASNTIIYR